MKKLLSLTLLVILSNFAARATDLIVEEFGSLPTYSSIAAAVAASADGDRIIIKNRAGNIPWVEDITITKTLDFLPYQNDTFFFVQGNYTLTPGTSKNMNIIGMYNTNGSITVTGTPTGSRSNIRVLGSYFVNGSITANVDNLDVIVSGCKLITGGITIRHGNVLGNDINAATSGIITYSETATNNDTIFLMSNRITAPYPYYGINWNSTSSFMDIRNNFITYAYYGINLNTCKASNAAINKIYNNTTTVSNPQSSNYAIYVTSNTSSIVEVMNNLCDKNTSLSYTYYGISANPGGSSQINCYYNYLDNTLSAATSGTFTVNQNNTTATVTVNSTTGASTSGVDAGNPSTIFYDLDLTRNDCGAYGGSFSQNNYFPQFTGSARVFMTSYPFNIRTGNTLSVKGTSYDR